MKLVVVSMAALSVATPTLAEDWPKQDWSLLQVKPMAEQAPASAKRDGGAYPPQSWMTGAGDRLGGPAPGSRQNIALNLSSINRVGNKVEVRYFVWPDDKSNYIEITSQIDCSKTGEQVVLWRQYDRDFSYIGMSSQGLRRTNATARAIAGYACRPQQAHSSGGKSLPEIVQGE